MAKKPLKIAVFTAYFYPHEGGTEKYAQNLFSDLKDIDVTLITCNTERSPFHEKRFGMDIYRFSCWHTMGKTNPIIKFSEYDKIENIFKENEYDFIITQTRFFNTAYVGTRIAKKFKIPLIHIEHGTQHSPIKNPIMNVFGKLYDHTIGKYIIKNAIKLIGISKASEEFIRHIRADAKTERIYNSIDTAKFKKITEIDQSRLKKSLGIKDEKIVIFVGRIIYAKGVQDLLEATKDISDIKVIIIGDGNYLDQLKKEYPWAMYLGQKNIEEVKKYLSIADIFVNPSYAEGLPTSILEAGAMGVPVIATDVGGTREIIENGKNGSLVKAKDHIALRKKILELLDDKRLREKYSRGISLKVKKEFDWRIARSRFQRIIQELAERKK